MSHMRSDLGFEIPTFQTRADRGATPNTQPELLARIAAVRRLWHERRAARRALALLDARSLRDLGIAPDLVQYEIAQPFWRDLRDWRA